MDGRIWTPVIYCSYLWWLNVIYNSKLRLLHLKLGTISQPYSLIIFDFFTFIWIKWSKMSESRKGSSQVLISPQMSWLPKFDVDYLLLTYQNVVCNSQNGARYNFMHHFMVQIANKHPCGLNGNVGFSMVIRWCPFFWRKGLLDGSVYCKKTLKIKLAVFVDHFS